MMMLSEAARALAAQVEGADVMVNGVSTDTRTIKPGDLFVALRGERFDGHAFVAAALSAGAAAAMIDAAGAGEARPPIPTLVVDDTRLALGRLAAHWRTRFDFPLVALTGSSGKTTVKEMLAAILRTAAGDAAGAGAVLATRGNLNNDIGVPLMLLEMRPEQRYAVIEMGMNHAGEIRYLCEMAKPDVVLVTNAGRAHIEYLGSEEAIARAKGEIFDSAPQSAAAVINADDRFAPLWRQLAAGRRTIEFGLDSAAAVTATHQLRDFDSEIVLETPSGAAATRIPAPGVHNVRNALAAAAAAVALDIALPVIADGLTQYRGIKGRLQRKSAAHAAVVIDDTYNANPESVRAAIDVLARSSGTRILVFGDMGELGADAPHMHEELGEYAKRSGIERVMTLGEHSELTARAFGAGAQHYPRVEELIADARAALGANVTVLVKGSRFMKMERVVEAIAQREVRSDK
jgi:UDP-N-acetylmuramoyl-tripeptide--D-alanyl-D-alanine ligase